MKLKKIRKLLNLTLVFSMLLTLFVIPDKSAQAAITTFNYGLNDGNQANILGGTGPTGTYWYRNYEIYVGQGLNSRYAGKNNMPYEGNSSTFQYMAYGTQTGGYPYVDKSVVDAWISKFNGNRDYVWGNLSTGMLSGPKGMNLPNGKKNVPIYSLSQIAQLSGGVGFDFDLTAKRHWFISTQKPIAVANTENSKRTYSVGDTIRVRGWGEVFTVLNKTLTMEVSGPGIPGGTQYFYPPEWKPSNDSQNYQSFQWTSNFIDIKANNPGTYTYTVRVRDSVSRWSNPASVTVQVNGPNAPTPPPPPAGPPVSGPFADFTMPTSTGTGDAVNINDRSIAGSSPIVNWSWSVSPNQNMDGTLAGTSSTVSFSNGGLYRVTLTVRDANGLTSSVTKSININAPPPPPLPPVAKINAPQEVMQGDDLTISSGSYDPDGTITDTQWSVTPAGMIGNLSGQSSTVYFDKVGQYVLNLTVKDNDGLTATASTTINVKPAVPTAYFEWTGDSYPKQNRKMVFDATKSTTQTRYPMDWSKTEWQFIPPTGVTADSIKIVDSPDQKQRTVMFKQPGLYTVKVRVTNAAGNTSPWFERPLEIYPDNNPHVDFTLSQTVYRDAANGNKAAIQLHDQSLSDDGDIISKRVWKYRYDSNNNGDFSDEQFQNLDSGNNPDPILYTTQVGKYQFELYVEETFGQATIPEFIVPGDLRSDSTDTKPMTDKTAEVINLAPVTGFEATTKKKADIVFTIGKTSDAKINNLNSKINAQMQTKFAANNIDAKITAIQTSQLTTQNTFSWQEYSHYYTDSAYSGATSNGKRTSDHIVVNGKSITFYGYDSPGYKDFLFMPDANAGKKTFTFDMNEGSTVWHALQGAGYLFNAKIENGNLSGYAILLEQDGTKLYKIDPVNVNTFWNNPSAYGLPGGTLIKTFPKTGSVHSIKIEATPDVVNMWDNGKQIMKDVPLPVKYGNGFGPMTSYYSHGCWQLSYITFNNIIMDTVTGKNFDDVVKEPTWRDYSSRYIAQISDEEVKELNDPQKSSVIYSRLLNDNIDFSTLGTNVNKAQAERAIGINNGNGIFLDNGNMDAALSAYADYIIGKINQSSNLTQFVLVGQDVVYNTFYNDSENDPAIQSRWKYTHDPNYFDNSQGLASFNEQYLQNPITNFDKVGKYTVVYQARDNPKNDNRFDNYRLWSEEPNPKLDLIVHRKPLAVFTPKLKMQPGGFTYDLSITENSYDLDHEKSRDDKGIVDREWKYREASDLGWTNGMPPSTLQAGKTYLISLKVLDPEGAWSDANVQVVTTDANMPPVANFKMSPNPVPVSKFVTYTDSSYDPNGDPITQYRWRVQDPTGAWTDLGKAPTFDMLSKKTFEQVGTYRVELTVMDSKGAWSEPFYQSIQVIPENRPPVAKFTVTPNPVPTDVNVTYDDTSYDPDGDPIVQREWQFRKDGGAWQPGQPDYHTLGVGNYDIALRVKDQPPLPQLSAMWSSNDFDPANWYVQRLKVIEGNKKPIAILDVNPKLGPADEPVTWIDRSTDPEGKNLKAYELKVTQIESGVMKQYTSAYTKASGAALDMTDSFIKIFETSGFPNDGAGTFKIEYRVKDTTPNGLSPEQWSDWLTQQIVVEDPLRITGDVQPKTAHSGQAIKLTANTQGKAQVVYAKIDWNHDGNFNGQSEIIQLTPKFPTETKLNEWETTVVIPLPTKDGVYNVEFIANKISPWNGALKEARDSKIVTVKGNIFDDFIIEYYK